MTCKRRKEHSVSPTSRIFQLTSCITELLEQLRALASGTLSDLRISTIYFANPPKVPGHAESSKDGVRLFGVRKGPLIDITIGPALDKTTVLRSESLIVPCRVRHYYYFLHKINWYIAGMNRWNQ